MTGDNQPRGGPFVALAAFCDKVIEGNDNVLSLIRVVDRTVVTIRGQAPNEPAPTAQIAVTAVISLKSGAAKGSHEVRVRWVNPDESVSPDWSVTVLLQGDDHGVNVVLPLNLETAMVGVFWLEVRVDGALVTRMPYRVFFQTLMQPGT